MKNMNLFTLLLFLSVQTPIYPAQESSDFTQGFVENGKATTDKKVQDELAEQSRQEIITYTVKNFTNLVEGFDVLQAQNLINQSFYDYFTKNLNQDKDEDQEANSGDVITDAIDLVINRMKVPFLITLNQALIKNIASTKIYDPIFLYVMKYKDGFMQLPLKQWINEKNKKNHDRTPLHVAITEKNKEFANILIAAGANLNFKTNSGWAPLHAAVVYNYAEMTHILIIAGANINLQDNVGETPLHSATLSANAEMARMLIDAGANLNMQDKYGSTALHRAAHNNKIEIARLLIAVGANMNIKNNYNSIAEQVVRTSLMRAVFTHERQKQDVQTMTVFENQIKKDWR